VGEHRKYSEADLAKLVHMHKLVISGVSPKDAARLAVNHRGSLTVGQLNQVPCVDGKQVKALHRAAQVLDRTLVDTQIRRAVDEHGVAATWMEVLVPLLCVLGEEWERSGEGIAAEHMVSDVIKKILAERAVVEEPKNSVPVLLACIGDEMHSLALAALAAALAEQEIQVQFLGARTPSDAINEVVRRCAPPAIFLWAQLPENASLETVAALPTVRPSPRVILGGPGWAGHTYEGAFVAGDLMAACREITNSLGL
jgi:methylmalonyl-CoA mutase cobalamin-binding subunit